ncbi:CocE/NonD family hydrolase [Catellatospora sp. TT07R-123]|uniref:CocE/NonD family hydrolase n=1 Tax=Catellatospora sp. TT07R-123 TaxID=2733863 RepID=UPI001FD03227|nr:CocE/NonD family hydrolase [Catellatospora sp. TT07R-123]
MRRSLPLFTVVVLALFGWAAPAHAGTTTGFRFVDIAAPDGVVLKANVIEPTSPGRHPAIVFPSSWGLNDLEYLAQASALAQGGYTVVSYTPRGWWTSGGEVDTAGPKDIADVSRVLDWTVANTTADASRLGMAGVSYGAGISLIASGHDSRIRAVAALSGWSDLVASLYGGDTRRLQSTALLVGAAALLADTSDEFDTVIGDFYANRNIDGVKSFARARSAGTYLSAINASRPAILMANGYGDSIFPPNQLTDFFTGLAGPKRLEFAPGDHAIPELTGLAGLDNHVWTSVRRWMDRYLQGAANGIDAEPPVVLRSMTGGAVESYPNWAAVNTTTTRYGLGEVSWLTGTGRLGGTPSTGWSRRTWFTVDTVACGGVILLSNGLQALTGIPPTAWLPAVDRNAAGVWQADDASSTIRIRGTATVHARFTPTERSGTLVAYLYDVDWAGTGRLITQAPGSWLNGTAGAARTLDIKLPATSWDVPAGHHLALVLDGHDGYYLDENGALGSVLFSGQSWLDLPVR